MPSKLDGKKRVVLPKDIVVELGHSKGTSVALEKRKDLVIIKKVKGQNDILREAMSWNPTRIKKPQPVVEKEIKEIWD